MHVLALPANDLGMSGVALNYFRSGKYIHSVLSTYSYHISIFVTYGDLYGSHSSRRGPLPTDDLPRVGGITIQREPRTCTTLQSCFGFRISQHI